MANNKLFQKRKKLQKDLARQKAKRLPFEKALIVCEDSKSTPHYLEGFRDALRLSSINVKIFGKECGSDPKSVIDFARQEYLKEKRKGDSYDKVFCVIDKDSHNTLDQAKNDIRVFRPRETLFGIISVPCFEYFLLLHYEFTTKSFAATGNKSVCGCVIHDLKKYIPDYRKGDKGIYEATKGNLEIAIKNCKKANLAAHEVGTDNPTTLMHELIEYLRTLESN